MESSKQQLYQMIGVSVMSQLHDTVLLNFTDHKKILKRPMKVKKATAKAKPNENQLFTIFLALMCSLASIGLVSTLV